MFTGYKANAANKQLTSPKPLTSKYFERRFGPYNRTNQSYDFFQVGSFLLLKSKMCCEFNFFFFFLNNTVPQSVRDHINRSEILTYSTQFDESG